MLSWFGKMRRTARALARSESGAAAVELALIAVPFFLLLFGIIELALVFLLSTSLENATDMAARQVRTGAMQTAGGASAATFKTLVCKNLGWLQNECASNLYVDVRTFASFKTVTAPQPVVSKTVGAKTTTSFDPTKLTFDMGKAGDIVVVRTYYSWPLITPMVQQAIQTLSDGHMVISSTAAFRNEPYGS
jgi:Flp pilus assembly protein TadG